MSGANMLLDGPETAPLTLVLAHGAGAPMDSDFMAVFAEALAATGLRVARFEFPYMAARRAGGGKRPPDREPRLLEAWRDAIAALGPGPLAIGGKSLGGRMASLIAGEGGARALVCLGYPFHPPGRPERLRTAHLEALEVPTLIVQGARDPFGNAAEVPAYRLSPRIRFHWAEDGDHSLVPRKASGRTREQNWAEAVEAIAAFLQGPEARP
jgi:predicted alpha/beta-hydrolase family hydrolase